jgi:hypothetical protein
MNGKIHCTVQFYKFYFLNLTVIVTQFDTDRIGRLRKVESGSGEPKSVLIVPCCKLFILFDMKHNVLNGHLPVHEKVCQINTWGPALDLKNEPPACKIFFIIPLLVDFF